MEPGSYSFSKVGRIHQSPTRAGGLLSVHRVPAPCPRRLPHTCVQKSRGGEMVGQASLLQSHGRTPDTGWTLVLLVPKHTRARRGSQAAWDPQACQPRDTHHDLRRRSSGLCTRAASARRVLPASSGHVKRPRSAQAHSAPARERGRPRQRARRLVARISAQAAACRRREAEEKGSTF